MPRHIASLDVLRGIAVLLVVFVHVPVALLPADLALARAYLRPGYMGVDIFFALSGFLITRILIAERGQPKAWRHFWIRRVLRIFPIYYLLTAIIWVTAPGPEMPWVATYTSNFYFLGDEPRSYLAHTWSLAVEEHFYLVWPFVVLLATRRVAMALIIGVLIPLAFAAAYWVIRNYTPVQSLTVVGHITPTRILTLSLGSLLAFGEGFLSRHRLSTGLAALALIPAGYALGYFGFKLPMLRPLTVLWLLVGGALMSTGITLLCIQLDGAKALGWGGFIARPLRAIGRVSYGLYLYHFPIMLAFAPRMLAAQGPARYGWLALSIALSGMAALVSYRLIERPILLWAKRFRGRRDALGA